MKTNSITKWAALLLTFSGMAALPLTVTAQQQQQNGPGLLTVPSGTYSTTADGAAGFGFYAVNGGTISANNATINTTGNDACGVYINTDSRLVTDGLTVHTSDAAGVYISNYASADIRGLVASTTNRGGVYVGVSGTANLNSGAIITVSGSGRSTANVSGLQVTTNAVLFGTEMTIEVNAIYLSGTNGITATQGVKAQTGGFINLGTNTRITTLGMAPSGRGGTGIHSQHEDSLVQGHAATVNASGFVITVSDGARVVLTDSVLTGTQGGISIGSILNDMPSEVNISGGSLTVTNGNLIDAGNNEHGLGTSGANAVVNISDAQLNGNYLINNTATSGTLTVNLSNADTANAGGIENESNTTVNVSGGTGINGDATNSGSGVLNINLDDSKLTGDINSSGSSTINITGSNGSTVTGTATSKDDSNITINIDGPGSSWVGDTNQQDDSKIIINITGGGSGTGGFNGGDLNVGPDSEFTFDKDSHGNNGKNDGTWNIGDNEVKFDNLENNGKIVINVDTDSGTPKGSVSTDNGSGNGHIVINPGGNGTGNPDDILNGVVNGPGTDGWTWDNVDWGLKELEVTGNPDGSVNVRESGRSSTVSALTIGLIAAQQNSWFAQQNSLLKRMGDLRLNAERTVNISGKEDKDVSMPTADALISNIWIRSYGAQYNYGTQVTGRSFKQYAYGVDLGTDHKWTLNADNDLYTGVFAGYGAADTDHRYNGSESNLNNYYAGFYASWLNDSGWYLDATLKAQYSDHELKGYHGGIDYFSAKYNNWSVGGSVELGKKFTFQHDWFIEPQLQANYLHILADDYSVNHSQTINVSDLDAFQLRAGIVAGRTLKLKNGGALQPYVKLSGVEMVSSGGKIRAGYQTQRPNLDGTHAELGAGIIWQLDEHNQLHLDYEASFGDKYDKPWGLTAGYRYQF